MTGLVVSGQLALVLAAFWLPGALVLRTAGVRGLALASLAPLVTSGLAGPAAVVAGLAGVAWGAGALALVTVASAAGVLLVRRRRGAPPGPAEDRTPPGRLGLLPWAGAGVAVVGTLVPLLRGVRDPARVADMADALFHLNGLEFVRRTGRASSFDLSALAGEELAGRFYPAGWHAVAGTVPVVDARTTVLTLAACVPVVLAWSLGLAHLARVVLPDSPAAHVLAPIGGALVGAAPVYLVTTVGLVPNAWGLALVPAALAAVATRWLSTSGAAALALAAAAALALAHPSALVPAVVVAMPLVVGRIVGGPRPAAVRWLGAAAVVAGAVVLWAAVAAAAPHDRVRIGEPSDPAVIWRDLAAGSTGVAFADGTVLMLLALAGAVLAVRRRATRWLTVSAVLMVVWFVVLRLRLPELNTVFDPWYGEARRIGPVLTVLVALLAGHAVDRAIRALVDRGHLQTALPSPVAGAVVGVVLLAVPAAESWRSLESSAAHAYGHEGTPRWVSEHEQDLLSRPAPWVAGTVLGSPGSGAAHLYGTAGAPVALGYVWSVAGDDVALVDAAVTDGAVEGAEVCAALGRLGATHLYVDTEPAYVHEGAAFDVVPDRGVETVRTAGSARLLRVTGCG